MNWFYTWIITGVIFGNGGVLPGDKYDIRTTGNVANIQLADETEKSTQNFPLSADGRVSVSNVNGSIQLDVWEKNEVQLEITKVADSKETLADIKIEIDARPDSLIVEAEKRVFSSGSRGWKKSSKREVHFKLLVPRAAILNEIGSVNGSISISGAVGSVKASAVNGDVTAKNLRSDANLSTVNGAVEADFEALGSGKGIVLSTVNGGVTLTIPSDSNATLKADSLNGNIKNDFGLAVRKRKYIGRDMHGRLGSGETRVKLESINGPLSISRRNDGKTPLPVTNLTQSDDSDMDVEAAMSEIDSSERVAHMKKEIAAASAALDAVAPAIEKSIEAGLSRLSETEALAAAREGLRNSRVRLAAGSPPMIISTERKSGSIPVKANPKIVVDASQTNIKFIGWNKDEVRYEFTEPITRRDRDASPFDVKTSDNRVTFNIKSVNALPARLEVYVPRKTNLDITTDGEIRLDGISGELELKTVDGSINVRDSEGKAKITAVDSLVRIIGFRGELDSSSVDSDMFLEGDFSRVNGEVVDGDFVLTVGENFSADIVANVDQIDVENLPAPKPTGAGTWRIGGGDSKLKFRVTDGNLRLRGGSTNYEN